jgi:hypothetical protein
MMPLHDWTKVYAGLFHDFHQGWSIEIRNALNRGQLPDGYHALVEQKMSAKEADVLTIDTRGGDSSQSSPSFGTLLLEPPKTQIVRKSSQEHYADKANRIVIRYKLGRTVAVIEIVSPGNKDSKQAFKEFVETSQEFIKAGVHLLVIDLFPPTKRYPQGVHQAIWDEFEEEDTEFNFPNETSRILASYNSGRRKEAYVEPLALNASLPDMPLFLTGQQYINVSLERCYVASWSVMPKVLQDYVISGIAPISPQVTDGDGAP